MQTPPAIKQLLRPGAPTRKRTRAVARSHGGLQPRVLFGKLNEEDQMDRPLDEVFPSLVINGPTNFPPARNLLLLGLSAKRV